jgi:hypothetical protein
MHPHQQPTTGRVLSKHPGMALSMWHRCNMQRPHVSYSSSCSTPSNHQQPQECPCTGRSTCTRQHTTPASLFQGAEPWCMLPPSFTPWLHGWLPSAPCSDQRGGPCMTRHLHLHATAPTTYKRHAATHAGIQHSSSPAAAPAPALSHMRRPSTLQSGGGGRAGGRLHAAERRFFGAAAGGCSCQQVAQQSPHMNGEDAAKCNHII